MSGLPAYRRATLAALLPNVNLAYTEPVNYLGDLADEERRALLNAALLTVRLDRTPDDAPARSDLIAALLGERAIIDTLRRLQDVDPAIIFN